MTGCGRSQRGRLQRAVDIRKAQRLFWQRRRFENVRVGEFGEEKLLVDGTKRVEMRAAVVQRWMGHVGSIDGH